MLPWCIVQIKQIVQFAPLHRRGDLRLWTYLSPNAFQGVAKCDDKHIMVGNYGSYSGVLYPLQTSEAGWNGISPDILLSDISEDIWDGYNTWSHENIWNMRSGISQDIWNGDTISKLTLISVASTDSQEHDQSRSFMAARPSMWKIESIIEF